MQQARVVYSSLALSTLDRLYRTAKHTEQPAAFMVRIR